MSAHQTHERGQALVIIAFGLIALIGMTALAIDGGGVYSDRRHAQNAADTAVMAAGLMHIKNPLDVDWPAARDAGLQRAADNGYDNDGTTNLVNVYRCSDTGATCEFPADETYVDNNSNGVFDAGDTLNDTNGNGFLDIYDPHDFVQATVVSHVPTYFARVLGIFELTNSVQAVARAVPPSPIPWYFGNALVATMPGCKTGGWPHDPFTLSGNSVSLVTGAGGVFVNSTCANAFTANTNATMDSVSGICVVGGVVNNGNVNPPPDDYCGSPIDEDTYQLPSVTDASCTSNGVFYDVGGGTFVATPGRYSSTFPGISPAGTLKLQSGIYCLENGISVGAGWTITTDLDGTGEFDGSDGRDEGVLLYVPNGNVTFNGGAFVQIGAINKVGTDPGIKGYLLYLPPTNNSPVKLAGSNGSTFVGTILAPASFVTLEGGSSTDSLELECQIIGYSINVTGGGTLNIQYNQSKVAQTMTSPLLVPYR